MRRLLVVVLLLTLLPGCGRFVRSGSEPEPEAAPENERVGEGLEAQITTTSPPVTESTAANPQASQGGGAATTAPPRPTTAVRDDPSGFRLTLSIDGDGEYEAGSEAFTMKLEVRNTTREPKRYDPNQQSYFVMTGPGRWRDTDCGPRKPGGERPATLGPGQTVTFTARYPGPTDRLDKGDSCRRPAGEYFLGGGFEACPDPAIVSEEGPCDPSAAQTIRSAGVQVTLL
jgi:hypothetical protein